MEPQDPGLPRGLSTIENFISEAEEHTLLVAIDAAPWSDILKRRTQHYGYTYGYKGRKLEPAAPIPVWCEFLYERLRDAGLIPEGKTKPDQLIVNEYIPGQGISAHIDANIFGDTIISLSLGSRCMMIFSCEGRENKTLVLQPRSLTIMQGPARRVWKHEIPARKKDAVLINGIEQSWTRDRRVSLTFRFIA